MTTLLNSIGIIALGLTSLLTSLSLRHLRSEVRELKAARPGSTAVD
jgi:hypothetical protein